MVLISPFLQMLMTVFGAVVTWWLGKRGVGAGLKWYFDPGVGFLPGQHALLHPLGGTQVGRALRGGLSALQSQCPPLGAAVDAVGRITQIAIH